MDGTDARIDGGALEAFTQTVPSLRAGDPGYDEARQLWNGMIDKRPALIARCRGAADVARSVRFARAHDMRMSIRGGGHNIAGTASCDGGLMVDLSPMKGVRLGPEQRVWVQPGCTWADVDRETVPHGLAVPSGIISTTGVAGLTLGGGFGWLTRRYGLTSDQLLAADVITAEGESVRASESSHPELFWALRGGGGNFGVVTGFEFRARRHGPEAWCGLRVFPLERAREVFSVFQELTQDAPEALGTLFVLKTMPDSPALPERLRGRRVAGIAFNWVGEPSEGRAATAPLDRLGDPLADKAAVQPFTVLQQMLDGGQPRGRRYYWKSEYVEAAEGAIGDTLVDHASRFPSPQSSILMMHLGGAAARVDASESAAGHRRVGYVINIGAAWEEGSDEPRIAWARTLDAAIRPSSVGVYVNFLTAEEGADRVRAAYPPAVWERLRTIKRQWDPANVFRLNKNIPPG